MCEYTKFTNILLHADVWRCLLEDLLYGRSQVVHLTLVFSQRHLQVLKRKRPTIWNQSLYITRPKGEVIKEDIDGLDYDHKEMSRLYFQIYWDIGTHGKHSVKTSIFPINKPSGWHFFDTFINKSPWKRKQASGFSWLRLSLAWALPSNEKATEQKRTDFSACEWQRVALLAE